MLAAHTGQVRMGTSLPYVVHPMSLALAAAAAGLPEDDIIADLFHDAVEDTNVTEKQIRKEYGDAVADKVMLVTKDPALTKMQNVEKICRSGLNAVQRKLRDTRHNMSDLDPNSSLYAFYERSVAMLESAEAAYMAAGAAAA